MVNYLIVGESADNAEKAPGRLPKNTRKGIEMRFFQKTNLAEKISEALSSVLPVTGIVLLLLVTFVPVSSAMFMSFIIGAVMLILGMGLFSLGADMAMSPMGEYVGSKMTASKKIWVVVLVSFFVGVMITVSEPDLQVLANQISSIENIVLILAVGIGVGLLLVMSMLRILFRIKLKYLLLVLYAAVFVLAFIVPENFIAVSFDSGGVTTGPMTVPFIMALGVGVSAISSDDGEDSSFGMVALCSVGPILAVMLLGIIYPSEASADTVYPMPPITSTSRDIVSLFLEAVPHYMWEISLALGPILAFFLIFRLIFRGGDSLGKILVGILYTYVGLVLFLTGVNVGFMPVGNYLGSAIAGSDYKWLIIPLGMIIGYFIVAAEPAVHVLTKQVEEVTAGAIPKKMLSLSLSLGVAVSVGIAMLRALTGISIFYILIPGYAIALALTFFVPDIFTSIAFDSGGVASGPMTATFLLPFAVGACTAVGGNVVTDAFGVVAMVAMTPLIAIQILGLVYKLRLSKKEKEAHKEESVSTEDDIIDL